MLSDVINNFCGVEEGGGDALSRERDAVWTVISVPLENEMM